MLLILKTTWSLLYAWPVASWDSAFLPSVNPDYAEASSGNAPHHFITPSLLPMKNLKAITLRFLREYSFDLIIGFLLATCFLFFMSVSARAQNVGINNPTPHAKSLLDLTSTDKGLLAPRMTQAQRLAMFPAGDATAKGMLVYQTDNAQGFYYYDGSVWMALASGT